MTRTRRWMLFVTVLGLVGIVGGFTAWSLGNGSPPPRFTVSIGAGEFDCGFAPDSRSFVTQGKGVTTLWDAANGRPTRLPAPTPTSGLSNWLRAYTGDHQRFAGWSVADQAVVWGDTTPEQTRGKFPLTLSEMTLLPHLGWVEGDRCIQLVTSDPSLVPRGLEVITWNIASGVETRRTTAFPAGITHIPTAYSPDGRTWVYLTPNRDALQFWDVVTDLAIGVPLQPEKVQPGSTGTRYTIAVFTHDGQTLVIGRDDGRVDLWDVTNRRLRRTVRIFPPDHSVYSPSLSPDDHTLATTGQIPESTTWPYRLWGMVRWWVTGRSSSGPLPTLVLTDLTTDKPLARYPATIFWGFSPDGRLFSTLERPDRYSVHDVPQADRR